MDKRSEQIFEETFNYLCSILIDKAKILMLLKSGDVKDEDVNMVFDIIFTSLKASVKKVVDSMLKNVFEVPKKKEHEYILQAYIITMSLCAFLGFKLEPSEDFPIDLGVNFSEYLKH